MDGAGNVSCSIKGNSQSLSGEYSRVQIKATFRTQFACVPHYLWVCSLAPKCDNLLF
jgi:hypothetical protein